MFTVLLQRRQGPRGRHLLFVPHQTETEDKPLLLFTPYVRTKSHTNTPDKERRGIREPLQMRRQIYMYVTVWLVVCRPGENPVMREHPVLRYRVYGFMTTADCSEED